LGFATRPARRGGFFQRREKTGKQEARRTGVRGETYAYWYFGGMVMSSSLRITCRDGIKGEIDLVGYDGQNAGICRGSNAHSEGRRGRASGTECHQGSSTLSFERRSDSWPNGTSANALSGLTCWRLTTLRDNSRGAAAQRRFQPATWRARLTVGSGPGRGVRTVQGRFTLSGKMELASESLPRWADVRIR
jgi:hypothetical protein